MITIRKPDIKKAGDSDYDYILDAADKRMKGLKAELEAILEDMASPLTVASIAQTIEAGMKDMIDGMINWDEFSRRVSDTMSKVYQDLVQEVGEKTVQRLNFDMRFDLLNPKCVEYIRSETGKKIVEITEETRQAVRDIVRRAFEEGGHPYEQAEKIQKVVGLTSRQANAVLNYRQRLLDEGKSKATVDKLSKEYADRLLKDRAENIARTETINAANAGYYMSLVEAEDNGLLDTAETEMEWVCTHDDRLCDECLAMDGKRAQVGGQFEGGISHPCLHPRCRCTIRLVRKEL